MGKKLQKQKQENFFRQITNNDGTGRDFGSDEVSTIREKLLKMNLPEEAMNIVE